MFPNLDLSYLSSLVMIYKNENDTEVIIEKC
jgi:hypothetical protein